jgi:type I restriction enzyme M protein
VYDPTCGSGSLLLKVGDAAATAITLNGQEKDAATSGLARMNMILHNNPTALIAQGNTLADPKFKDGDALKTFDYVVANPPFSDKRWSTGLDPLNDPFDRFKSFGVPPGKQGDYAYLLHIVRSLKSTGKGACILPHGVLFRGNAEADIRRALVRRGYLKGIIGLPANLFYGTGIPACIVVIDKEGAQARKGIFMIDASGGFMKDGPKNRLRDMDIHRIVDTFNQRIDVPKYARMVPFAEIEQNEFNLNLPRYIDRQTPEDLQDIAGHLQGGIPAADVDALQQYWEVCPKLRHVLFNDNRPGYFNLGVEKSAIKSAIYAHPEFAAFIESMKAHFAAWRKKTVKALKALQPGCPPKEIIAGLAEGLLAHYEGRALIDAYDVYQHLMDYWTETMQDDCYLIAADGWKAETARIIETDKKGKEKDKGWTCDLIPKPLIVSRYFAEEQAAIDQLAADLESAEAGLAEMEEEHGGEDGALRGVSNKTEAQTEWRRAFEYAWATLSPETYSQFQSANRTVEAESSRKAQLEDDPRLQELKNDKGNITKTNVKKRYKTSDDEVEKEFLAEYLETLDSLSQAKKAAKKGSEAGEKGITAQYRSNGDNEIFADLRVLDDDLRLTEDVAALKQQVKDAEDDLDGTCYAKYSELSESQIKSLIVEDKWLAALNAAIHGEVDRISQRLTQRVKELADRYETPLPQLVNRVSDLETKVNGHLERMGFA